MSPATAAVAALASAQGFARVVQSVCAVPVGDTYQVAATAGGARASAARIAEQKPRIIFNFVRNTGRVFPRAEIAIPDSSLSVPFLGVCALRAGDDLILSPK